MIYVGLCDGKVALDNIPPDRIAESLCRKGCVLWVDVIDPTEDDWRMLSEEFRFHPLAVEDARKKNQRAKMDFYPTDPDGKAGYLFFALRTWAGIEPEKESGDVVNGTRELDVFLGRNYIVTIRNGTFPAVEETRRRWQNNFSDTRVAKDRPSFLLYLLLDAVVDEFFPVVDAVDDAIEEVEIAIYGEESKPANMKDAIRLKRELLLLRQAITPLRDVLNHLLRTDDEYLLPNALRIYFQDVYDHTLRLVEQVDLHREILSGAMEATMAQTSNRLNQVMKTMTALSTILMSATVITGIYGMNFDNMPELHSRNGYFIALGVMIAVALGLAAYFRRIGWF
ncbi:MAG: magnesium/cobalt transporter CorA [Capsulimonadales bacterium]|nr:magnesium/cobalt transporter CorA [Capsulimonadales bacterium]